VFGNHYWPALYFADAQGRVRHHHFGEGEYGQSEMVIQQLLGGAGSIGVGTGMVSVDPGGVSTQAIAGELDGGASAEEAAEDFGLDTDAVRRAQSYELSQHAAA
jgi:uncharacterized protein (DUF433 family)